MKTKLEIMKIVQRDMVYDKLSLEDSLDNGIKELQTIKKNLQKKAIAREKISFVSLSIVRQNVRYLNRSMGRLKLAESLTFNKRG